MKANDLKSLPILVLVFLLFFSLHSIIFAQAESNPPAKPPVAKQDTSKKDTTKQIPGYYKAVDVKIVYPWMPDEPQWYRNVCCQVVKKGKKVTELNVFLKTCTEKIEVKKGYIHYEIRDHKTKKLLEKGP